MAWEAMRRTLILALGVLILGGGAASAEPYAVLAFSGDSEWVDSLVDAGRGADLFIVECYQFDGVPRFHMSWKKIETQLDRIGAKRVMLTHMATDMLARRNEVNDARCVLAEDGLVLDV